MEGPLNPQENLDSLGPDANPFEDPMLDAVEGSIENPPGFIDPLVENEQPFIDDLAMQLDAVEAYIENSPPMPPQPTPVEPPADQGKDETDASEQEPSIPVSPSTPDVDKSSEDSVGDEEEPGNDNLHGLGDLERFFRQRRSGSTAKPPRKPYGDGWRQGGHPRMGGTSRGRGTGTKGSSGPRYCPDSRDLVNEDKCNSCEKYRHWPEGTDEEPRACWYDWQLQFCEDDSEE